MTKVEQSVTKETVLLLQRNGLQTVHNKLNQTLKNT